MRRLSIEKEIRDLNIKAIQGMGKAKNFMEDTDSDVLTEIKQSKSSNESEPDITNSSNEGDWIDYS